ncbi:MAG: substrate-binding domain-containing protein [Opitutaceae bacterium]|jgi:LacI family transcriptional regulator
MTKRSRQPAPPFRVQIVINPDQEYFREVVLGVRHYGFETGRLVFADRWLAHELADLPRVVKRDGVQGIVAAAHTVAMESAMMKAGVPVVNVSNSMRVPRLPVVTQDDVAVGKLAAEHLRNCGCRSFGFWGQAGASYAEQRWQGFGSALGENAPVRRAVSRTGEAPGRTFARMREWLKGLERPAGVFTTLDSYALTMQRAARESGWRVPEDLAVLGAGDDDFLVQFEQVPLSSIRLPSLKIGYAAGVLLDRLIATGAKTAESVQLPAGEIVSRRSTDVIYSEDEAVARAVRFIREHATANPYVGDVVKVAGISRTALQTRFRAVLGRSPLQEILRVRVARAQALLTETTLPMTTVAERCGFPDSQRFCMLFRRVAGVTPTGYRWQFRQ